jgi:hypothetical protein
LVGPGHRGGMAVGYFAGIDVSLEASSVCVVDGTGRIVREGKARNEPEALAAFLHGTGLAFERVGLEAGPLSQWLHAGLGAVVPHRIWVDGTSFRWRRAEEAAAAAA